MSVVTFPSPPEWLLKYRQRGFRLVFFPAKLKGPREDNWPANPDVDSNYSDGMNVGIVTGHEITPGKFLVDIDFDWDGGLSMLKRFLLPTQFGFGRPSRPVTHAFYTTPAPIPTRFFKDIDGKHLIEIR